MTADLSIIHGFAAELPARAVPQLAIAPGVRWISLDAPVVQTACNQCIDTSQLQSTYIRSIRADQVWNRSPYRQGQNIGVAVVDSGINNQVDFYTLMGQQRLVAAVAFNNGYNTSTYDGYGHGSHVAGVVGGNGRGSNGAYIGVAPMSNIINVKVGDDLNQGQGTARTVVQGLQWILENKDRYNIKVVNLSLNSAVYESYHTSPINAAVEILWFNKIVVVVSAGNNGGGTLYPPANDPFVITVGAVDERGTSSISDDQIASFSAYGRTPEGFDKPDLVAPGRDIVSLMGNSGMGMPLAHPDHLVTNNGIPYFRLSGTSAAAPMVAGAAALLLQDEPGLTPDQVKYRLMASANKGWSGYQAAKAGAGYLDIYAAISGNTTQSANTGIQVSQLLQSGSQPVTGGNVSWNSVSWNSVSWNSVSWNSVSWNSVSWNSDYWGN
ncbi:MAG: S8 family peptidase [Caldilineaceae bacterium]